MCGRFSLFFFPDAENEFEQRFGIPFPTVAFAPSYNIPPGVDVSALHVADGNDRKVERMFWGLIPPFAEEFKPHPRFKMVNTRIETLNEPGKNFRKELLRVGRCIIPANNYFEWRRSGRMRLPYAIRPRDQNLLALAGIYSRWQGEGGEVRMSCSILTRPASEELRTIHHRMPVILSVDAEGMWLDPEADVSGRLEEMVAPPLDFFPVSRAVNDVRNDSAALVEPVSGSPAGEQFDMFG